MDVLVWVGIIAVVIALAIYAHRVAEKRKLAIAAWANGLGLSFTRDRDGSVEDRYPDLAGLREGDDRYAENISAGAHGKYSVCAFDYHYVTYSHDSKGNRTTQTHRFSSVILGTPLPLKQLKIRSENFFDKIGEFVGFEDINFESAEFSRAFHVTSPDKRWAFDVLHQESMEFLLAAPRFQIEFERGCVMTRKSGVFKPEEFDAALKVAVGLLDKLPQSVVRELGRQP